MKTSFHRHHILRLLGAVPGTALPLAAPAARLAAPHYTLTASISLGAPTRWDYVTFDPATQRVYVAHGTQVTVVDTRRGAVIGSLAGIDGAHGIVPLPARGEVFADAGKAGTVIVFDATTYARRATIAAVGDADGMIFDPASDRVVVLGGNSAAAGFIDPGTDRLTATLGLGGSPEGVAVDGVGRMYVNIEDRDEIAVVDTRAPRVIARWKLRGCADPHGLAIDPAHRRLFVSCPAGRMAEVDIATGRQVGLVPIEIGTDGAGFDPVHGVALSSDGDGTLGIVADDGRGLGTVATEAGARTMAVDPKNGRVFVVTATVKGVAPARKPGGRKRFVFVPGTVRLLVYTPRG